MILDVLAALALVMVVGKGVVGVWVFLAEKVPPKAFALARWWIERDGKWGVFEKETTEGLSALFSRLRVTSEVLTQMALEKIEEEENVRREKEERQRLQDEVDLLRRAMPRALSEERRRWQVYVTCLKEESRAWREECKAWGAYAEDSCKEALKEQQRLRERVASLEQEVLWHSKERNDLQEERGEDERSFAWHKDEYAKRILRLEMELERVASRRHPMAHPTILPWKEGSKE